MKMGIGKGWREMRKVSGMSRRGGCEIIFGMSYDLAGSVLFKTLYLVRLGRALTAYGASASKRSLGLLGLMARNLLAALGVAVYFFSSDIFMAC